MRLHSGKADCLVLDFAGNIVEHGPVDAIRPPKRPGEKAKSEAPVRECPRCHEHAPIQARTCPACGYEWPVEEKPKHDATASDAAILSDELAEPKEWPVYGVRYSRHEKQGRPTSLRVTYTSSNGQAFHEWVCLEHGGIVRAKAMTWWMARDESGLTPQNVEAALGCTSRLAVPSHLFVREIGKFPEIVGYTFPQNEAAA
jgi:DNA repair protein RadD